MVDYLCEIFKRGPTLREFPGSPVVRGFPSGSEVKASACNEGDLGSIPGSGRSPGEGTGNPPQYSCLENPMDTEAWWAIVHGVSELDATSLPLFQWLGLAFIAEGMSLILVRELRSSKFSAAKKPTLKFIC